MCIHSLHSLRVPLSVCYKAIGALLHSGLLVWGMFELMHLQAERQSTFQNHTVVEPFKEQAT